MSKQRTWKKVLCNMVVGSLLLSLCPPLIQAETAIGTENAKMAKVATDIPAFPGAEGGGKYVTGGRGGEVYEVTTLADYGKGEQIIPGSFAQRSAPIIGRSYSGWVERFISRSHLKSWETT